MEVKSIIKCDGGFTSDESEFGCHECGLLSHTEYTFKVTTFLLTVQQDSYFYLCKDCHTKNCPIHVNANWFMYLLSTN